MDKFITLIEEFKKNSELYEYGEESIKHSIILRILSDLGWDIFNREEVFPEYPTTSGRVDYSLRINSINKVFIEAKSGRIEFKDNETDISIQQLLTYCFEDGVDLAVLTNGISWWFYLPRERGHFIERRFYTIDLFAQKTENISTKFKEYLERSNVFLGKSHEFAKKELEDKQNNIILQQTLPKTINKLFTDFTDEIFLELIAEETEKICGKRPDIETIKSFLLKYNNEQNIPIIEVNKKNISRKKNLRTPLNSKSYVNKLYWYEFKNNNRVHANSTKEIYKLIIELFSKLDPNFIINFSKECTPGGRKYVAKIQDELYPGRPDLGSISKRLYNGWYLGTNYSREYIQQNIKKACDVFGITFGRELKIDIGI